MENRMYPTSFQSLSWVKTVQQQSIIRVWFGFIMKRHYILSDSILQRPSRKAWTRRRQNLPFCVVKGGKTHCKTCPFGKQKDRLGKVTVRELIRQAFRERGKNGSSKHPMGFHGSATSRRTKPFNSNYGIHTNRSSDRLGRHEIPFMTLSAPFRKPAGTLSAGLPCHSQPSLTQSDNQAGSSQRTGSSSPDRFGLKIESIVLWFTIITLSLQLTKPKIRW